ncbi:ABC transporter substrate-binding protein [Chitinimonas sp. BJYL2]|uniref:substrate-binding periplasmic protein n=1 Tax=Chitinimonas sp. BJYL2 TaxID=2976696 RepID=UPI0022B324BF|nr:transporter substrate-binding domain-containing protein [Chitinimonas sp. BJYL2]
MIKSLFMLLLALAAGLAHAADRVRLASGEWPPYAGATLPQQGIAAQIIRSALADDETQVEFVHLSWKRGLELARRGHLDGAILWQPSRLNSDFLATEPLLYSEVVLAYRADLLLGEEPLTVPPGTRIGLPNGYKYEQIPVIQALLTQSGQDAVMILDDAQGIKALQVGRIDVFPIDRGVARWLLRHTPNGASGVKLRSQPVQIEALSVLLHRHTPKAERLLARINAGLARLRSSGQLGSLLQLYGAQADTPVP